jgi:ferredoxin
MLQVPLAVRDHLGQQSHYAVAPIGISLRHVMSQLTAASPRSAGDPWPAELALMRGHVLHEHRCGPETVVSGGDLTLHLLPRPHAPLADPCIRCAWCSESCPTRVQPAGLLEAAQRKDLAMARHYGLDSCIECGVCTYVCPSHLPLLAGIRTMKRMVNGE